MAALLALSAAVAYGVGDFLGGVAARRGRRPSVVLWSHLVGLVMLLALAPLVGGEPTARAMAVGAAAGLLGGTGVALFYRGLAVGAMSVVAPIAALLSAAVPVVAGLARASARARGAGGHRHGAGRHRPRVAGGAGARARPASELAAARPGGGRRPGVRPVLRRHRPRRRRRRASGRWSAPAAASVTLFAALGAAGVTSPPSPPGGARADRRSAACSTPAPTCSCCSRSTAGCCRSWPCSPRCTRRARCSWPATCSASGLAPVQRAGLGVAGGGRGAHRPLRRRRYDPRPWRYPPPPPTAPPSSPGRRPASAGRSPASWPGGATASRWSPAGRSACASWPASWPGPRRPGRGGRRRPHRRGRPPAALLAAVADRGLVASILVNGAGLSHGRRRSTATTPTPSWR